MLRPLRLGLLLLAIVAGCSLEQSGQAEPDASTGGKPSGGDSSVAGTAGWIDAAGSESSAGTGGVPADSGLENCANGADDDGDGDVDCADPDCGTHVCIPSPPVGWEGPIAFSLGAAPAPDCGAGYPTKKFQNAGELDIPAASCPTCSCNTATAVCPNPFVTMATDSNCSSGTSTQVVGSCVTISNASAPWLSAKIQFATASAGCTPVPTGAANIPTPTFKQAAALCGDSAVGLGCTAGKVCAAKTDPGFDSPCIYTGGAQASCPPEYPDPAPKFVVVDFTDNRACSACNCTPPLCPGSLAIYNYCGASSPLGTSSTNGQCVTIPAQYNVGAQTSTGTPSCTSSGGGLTGKVDPLVVTVCCLGPTTTR